MAEQLTDSAAARIGNVEYMIAGASLLGAIGGVVYSNRTGGGFWRGVGYFFLGSIVVGVTARIIAIPFENKIIKDGVTTVDTQALPE